MKRERILVYGFDIKMICYWYYMGLGLGIFGCGKRGITLLVACPITGEVAFG